MIHWITDRRTCALIAACFLAPLTCLGQGAAADKDWSADLSIYMLASGMTGNSTIHGVTADVDVPFSKIWENLQFGAMGRSTVRYRRWSLSTDVIYMGLGAAKNGFDLSYDQWMVEPVVEYKAASWFSPYAGARYLSVSGELGGPIRRDPSGKQSWWDPIVGGELRLPVFSTIRLRVRGDVGGFGAGSSFSGQIEPMLDWRVAKKISLQFGYRWMYADYRNGEGNQLYRYDLLTQGPQFGGTFHF